MTTVTDINRLAQKTDNEIGILKAAESGAYGTPPAFPADMVFIAQSLNTPDKMGVETAALSDTAQDADIGELSNLDNDPGAQYTQDEVDLVDTDITLNQAYRKYVENGVNAKYKYEAESTGAQNKYVDNTLKSIYDYFGKNNYVTSVEKGSRPDPHSYLTTEYIKQHLSIFKNGVTKIVAKPPTGTAGPPTGTFVIPYTEATELITKASGNISILENLLGLPNGSLGSNPVRIDILNPKGLRIPTGNELGANYQWGPGGFTSANLMEAISDSPKTTEYTVTKID